MLRYTFFLCAFAALLTLRAPEAAAQVSLPGFTNPGCEAGGTPPAGWSAQTMTTYYCDPSPAMICNFAADEGNQVFLADEGGSATISQVISPDGADALPGKLVTFTARARDCFSNTADTGTLRLIFLDAGGTVLATNQNVDFAADFGAWTTFQVQATAPASTRQVRIEAACTERSGGPYCDIAYDNMTLTTDTALPVELVAFTATLDGSSALLRWETASETNNAGFDVEHRQGTVPFRTVGFTPGRGTTAEASSYTHAIEGLAPGTHTFRLKQIDFDGAFAYSAEVEVTLRAGGLSLALRSVAAGIEGVVALPHGAARVEVYDVLGRRVSVSETTGAFAVSSLAAGVYVVRVEADAQVITHSVVVAR